MIARLGRLAGAILFALTALPAAATAPPADDPRDADFLSELRVGHWIEVRGELRDDGTFLAARVELQEPRRTSRLWGVAARGPRPGTLVVLGRVVDAGSGTDWRGTDLAQAPGRRVRVRGHRGPGKGFVAVRIEAREPGVERIAGRVDRIDDPDPAGGAVVHVLGFEIHVPAAVKQRLERPLPELQRVPARPLLTDRRQLSDLDDYFGEGFVLASTLHLGIQQDVNFADRRDFQLDGDEADRDDDDLADASHNLRARLVWLPTGRLSTVLDVRHRWRHLDGAGAAARSDSQLILNEAQVYLRDVAFGTDLRVGRQDFDEPREWVYDQNLDAVRLQRRTFGLDLDLSVSTTLDGGSRRDRDALNTILYAERRNDRRRLAGYVVNRSFGSGRDERQTHYGLRLLGPWSPRLDGWMELAHATGHRADREVAGWGGDLGLRYRHPGPARWTATAALALATGDEGGETPGAVDRRFRQTGLQDNTGRLGGLTAVQYYGELLNPELSNLEIVTLGLGRRFLRRTSLELIAHRYRQDVASTRLTRTNLERRPDGVHRELGWELDLVGALRLARWELEIVGAFFDHGDAFPGGDEATLVKAQLRYRY